MSFQKHFVYYLYRLSESSRYSTFKIAKKSGGEREISAPRSGLKTAQRRLAKLLLDEYRTREPVHSFSRGKSILTNAEVHSGSRFVMNIDLEDFFGAINFGRVRGMFIAKPYLARAEVATVLAQICCYKNKLPQGAPTSPVVSNMICARLDAQLRSLARELNCKYTRYCDDITFSTNRAIFPARLATIEGAGAERSVILSQEFVGIIEGNGFRINSSKTRLLSRSDRQDVTGLVTNKFPNVSRKYIRNIRAALHAWRKFGMNAAQDRFAQKYYRGDAANGAPLLSRVLSGRIQFVGHIRGYDDPVYMGLRDSFNQLETLAKIPAHQDAWDYKLKNAIWVLEDDGGSILQGTAFFAEGVGIVTCAHCVGSKPVIYSPDDPAKRYPLELVRSDVTIDLAILRPAPGSGLTFSELQIAKTDNPRIGQEVIVMGFPNHGHGKTMRSETSEIASLMTRSAVRKFNITGSIPAGNSGGPVFDRRRQIVGVAATGADHEQEGDQTDERSVIRISMLSSF